MIVTPFNNLSNLLIVVIVIVAGFGIFQAGCTNSRPVSQDKNWTCSTSQEEPLFLKVIGCPSDFSKISSPPLDQSIPGARSAKTIIDRYDDNKLYFQNSKLYPIHWDFANEHLSGNGLPIVPMLSEFNRTEYSSPSRRFILGAVTHYEEPNTYAYEIAPYDSATAEMILDAFTSIKNSTYFGDELRFFANSAAIQDEVVSISEQLNIITPDELFAGINYQPLNPAESYGRLQFTTYEALKTTYLSFRDIVVLDKVPNDISVVSGIITEEFQTPLSHINVLSRNRGTPNMALRGAHTIENLRNLEGKWVRLQVSSTHYEIEEVTQAEANQWWESNKPSEVLVPGLDTSIVDLRDIQNVINLQQDALKPEIEKATRAFGGKAAHYGALVQIENLPTPKAFAIPVYYYSQFLEENGFRQRIETLLQDETFLNNPSTRDQELANLRNDMMQAPLDSQFETNVIQKLTHEYPGLRMRFRSSTNAEDLDGFTGAGLYTSVSADPMDPTRPVADAIREVWSSIWYFRAFEERSYRSIDHLSVAMGLLVHRSFPNEEANGVALTNNPFDPSGLEPAFFINVQLGDTSVVLPPPNISADSFLYYYDHPDQPMSFLSHSNLTPSDSSVLTRSQIYALGNALNQIRHFFAPAYGTSTTWWAMDVEFKFDGLPGQEPTLYIKQARPYQ